MDKLLNDGLHHLLSGDPDINRLIGFRTGEVYAGLVKYIEEIELFNPAYGLVGTLDRRELIVKHILDSLAPLGILYRLLNTRILSGQPSSSAPPAERPLPSIADVGSGAGLPGIPLAICLSGCSVTLIERMGRRAGFLRNTLAILGLSNVTVEEAEMEKVPPGRFDLVTFRAFRPLEPKIQKGLFRLCAGEGVLAAYKGRRDKIEEEMEAAEKGTLWEIIPCEVPFLEEERNLAVIYKQNAGAMV